MISLKKTFFTFLLLTFVVSHSWAMNLGTYIKFEERIASEPKEKAIITAAVFSHYLQGIADGSLAGYSLARIQNKDNKSFTDYCPPKNLRFNGDLVKDIVDSYIIFRDSPPDESVNVGIVFATEMAKTYPCK